MVMTFRSASLAPVPDEGQMRRLVCEVRPAGKPGAPPFPYLPVVARVSSTRCLAAPREQAFESHHESHAFSD